MNSFFSQFDAPRPLKREELAALNKLASICFEIPEVSSEEAPDSYNPPKKGGSYILAHQGQLVSHLAFSHDQIKMYDGTIRAASIGGVCTHPDYQGKGLASYLLEFCTRKLVQEGARLMLISGAHGIYIRLGNVFHGRFNNFTIHARQDVSWRPTPTDLLVRRMTIADNLAASRLYQAEPVHYSRHYSDFSRALLDPMTDTYLYADQWIIERSGQPAAYLFLGSPRADELGAGIRHVSEYAGSRVAMVDALKVLLTTGEIQELTWQVAWQDLELIQLLQDCGFRASVMPLYGHTLRIVNFPGFMNDIRPILQARLGEKLLRGLRFEQSGPLLGATGPDRYAIIRGSDRLELDGAVMSRLVMGDTEGETEHIRLPGALAEVIPALFPLPSFLPGLNYH
jgi:GNAT superfamily N-acetyltransferase